MLVTGGASGIGAAVARRRATAGDHVVIADVDIAGGERVAAETGGVFVPTDVASAAANERAVHAAVERFGGLDVAFLNAGIPGGTGLGEAFDRTRYQRCVDVNLTGVVLGVQAALPHLRDDAAIVVTASLAGLLPTADLYYGATKHALVGLVRSLAMLLGARGIRVNALCPGFVDTAIIAPYRAQVEAGGYRIAEPDLVAAAFDTVVGGAGTGQAWVVAAGQELRPVEFPPVEP